VIKAKKDDEELEMAMDFLKKKIRKSSVETEI
jgi:hypothetical protein